jgi:LPS sulfotransferase NodH
MSYPFIIWTIQRTGGTSLANLLMAMSEHPRAEHEPFNWRRPKQRQFGAVAENWFRDKNAADTDAALAKIFSRRFLIKHCYELPEHCERRHGAAFNVRLMRAAAKTDYRHVLLWRRDELARLVSRFIAEANGTWFDDYASQVYDDIVNRRRELKPLPVDTVVKHYRHCLAVTEQVRAQAKRFGVRFFEIAYEDIYQGEREARMARLGALLQFIGIDPDTIERHAADIEDRIFRRRFDTGAVARFVPNLDVVKAALAENGYRAPAPAPVDPGAAPSWLAAARASLGRSVAVLQSRFRR